MLSIGMLAVGDEDYFIAVAAERAGVSRADEYFTGPGERPGMWVGGGSGSLGLSGPVEPADLRAVLAGVHPATDAPLTSAAAAARRTRPGMYLTFSAPKGVSLIGLLGDDSAGVAVREAQDGAVADALGYLEREALFARRGHEGATRVATGGFVAAAFDHSTSRAGDPQVHTHVLAANVVEATDGAWSAPDSRSLFRHARTAGFVYQAALRARLTESLGIAWGPVRAGMAEPAGIPGGVLRAFSTRRRQIEAHLDRTGARSAAAAQVAANATRAPKDHTVTAAVLQESWRIQADTLGFGVDRLAQLVGPGRSPETLYAHRVDLIDRFVGPAGLTHHAASFDRRDLLRAVAEAATDGSSPARLEAFADAVLVDGRVVPLAAPAADRPGPGEARFTTTELLAAEAAVVDSAVRRHSDNPARVAATDVEVVLAERPSLSAEQRHAVVALTTGPGGVAVLVGRAGTGKTFALDAARAAWESAGRTVIGAAPSARAAAELAAGSGIASTTLARLLLDAGRDGPGGGLPAGGVVVVDEAGMAGTRSLRQLLAVAERDRTQVVLVGDPAQLPEVEAGGTLRALAARVGAVELIDNRRQSELWERATLADLRAGRSVAAVEVYRDHGRLGLFTSAPDAHQALVADWWAARQEGATAAMYALRRVDVEALNRLARAVMADAGRLGPLEVTAAGRAFSVGDEIVALRNDRSLRLVNGTRATVTALDPATGSLTVTLDSGDTRTVPAGYLADGHLDHGYSVTIYKAQGSTVDRAFLLGSETLYREAGYVGLSRGRIRNDLYVVASDDDLDGHRHRNPIDGPTGRGQTGRVVDDTAVHDSVAGHDSVAVLAGPLARSRAQTYATDSGRPGPSPTSSLAELDDRRQAVLAAAGPEREARLQVLSRAVDDRRAALTRAALADPGPHLVDRLGPPPVAGTGRAHWAEAATAIESYRDRHGINGRDPLGPEPADVWASLAHRHAAERIERAAAHLGLPPVGHDRDLGIGR
jgi:conjugative relaxase-like TrwC/TraI family protein